MINENPYLFQWNRFYSEEIRYTLIYSDTPELAYDIMINALTPQTTGGTIDDVKKEFQVVFATVLPNQYKNK